MKEVWKSLKGLVIKNNVDLGQKYEVSNYGKVRNAKTKKIIKPNKKCGNGYLYTNMTFNNETFSTCNHRLVAIAFIPNPKKLPHIDHINGNRADNRVCNLRWTTRDSNNKGRKMSKAKITKIAYKDEIFYPLEFIPELEGYGEGWEISSYGRTRNIKTGKIYESNHKNKYRQKSLKKGNRTKWFCVHKLVAYAFVHNPDPANKTQVNHIDGNTHNNHWSNLEWVSPSENIQHAKQLYKQQNQMYPIVGHLQGQLEFDFDC